MMTTASEHKIDKVEKMAGGKGHVIIEHLLGEAELDGKCGLYAKVTIEPGCTLGFHEHHGETETYYILSGEGSYNDGEKSYPVKAGDEVAILEAMKMENAITTDFAGTVKQILVRPGQTVATDAVLMEIE